MADQDSADGTQAEPQEQPQAGNPNTTPQAGEEAISLEEARKLRREAQSLRKRLETYESEKLSATEKLNKRNQELETQLAGLLQERQERTVRESVAAAAGKAGALYPDTLYRLIEPEKIELDEAGRVRNVTALVNELRQNYPALFRAVNVDAGAGGRQQVNGLDMNTLIRQAAGRG